MRKAISIRLDQNILDYFKSQFPEGYQKQIHRVLKDYVDEQQKRQNYVAGRAQEIFNQFHAQCFWHYKKDLIITPELIPMVVDGLKAYGGHQGYGLAAELEA